MSELKLRGVEEGPAASHTGWRCSETAGYKDRELLAVGPAAAPRYGHREASRSPHARPPARGVLLILAGAVLGRAAASSPLSLISGAVLERRSQGPAWKRPFLGCSAAPRDPSHPCRGQTSGRRLPLSRRLSTTPPLFKSSVSCPPQGVLLCASRYDKVFQPPGLCICPFSLPGPLGQVVRQILL